MQKAGARSIGIVLLIVFVLIVVFSSYTIISPGHRGVVVMLGRVEQAVLGEGFHLVVPPVARQVIEVDVRTKKLEVQTESASSDLQALQIDGVLNYHLDPNAVNLLYQEVGLDYENIIIVPAMQEAIKAATAQYRIENILVQRAVIKDLIQDTLAERLVRNHIIVTQFSLADVQFSEEFNRAIEQKQVAEQAALQKQYELQSAQKDVEISLARAEGDRKAAIIAAQGRAEARLVEAEAEAQALGLIAGQLQGNPDLIRYEWATRLSPGVTTVLLPSDQDLILDANSLVGPQTTTGPATPATPATPAAPAEE
ncbi:MAG TPA: prohibitin family protein [Chloroflexi bacterium]|nr:prohibitin family protein [Chloroflexota bacterium]